MRGDLCSSSLQAPPSSQPTQDSFGSADTSKDVSVDVQALLQHIAVLEDLNAELLQVKDELQQDKDELQHDNAALEHQLGHMDSVSLSLCSCVCSCMAVPCSHVWMCPVLMCVCPVLMRGCD